MTCDFYSQTFFCFCPTLPFLTKKRVDFGLNFLVTKFFFVFLSHVLIKHAQPNENRELKTHFFIVLLGL